MKYKVYTVSPRKYYNGESLVAAENHIEANKFIDDFKMIDKENVQDSWGYRSIDEDEFIEHLYSDIKGIIRYGIYYNGY